VEQAQQITQSIYFTNEKQELAGTQLQQKDTKCDSSLQAIFVPTSPLLWKSKTNGAFLHS